MRERERERERFVRVREREREREICESMRGWEREEVFEIGRER